MEDQVWYRRLRVRIRKFGWKLRVTPSGEWILSRNGYVIRRGPPTNKRSCFDLAKQMRAHERVAKMKDKHGSLTRRSDYVTGPVWLFRGGNGAQYNARPYQRADLSHDDNCVVNRAS